MKQILHNFTQFSINVKRTFLVSIFLLVFGSIFGQNAIVGSGFSTGWGGGGCPTGNGDFKFFNPIISGTFGITTTANGTGDQYFRFGVDWSGVTSQLSISLDANADVAPNTTYTLNPNCTPYYSMKYNVPSTSYNYVFKTLNGGTNPTGKFIFFEVQGAIRSVIDVAQSPLSTNVSLCSPTTITATLDGNLALGQEVYMRYTNDGYATSTVLKLIAAGPTTYQGTIPSSINTDSAIVSYYVFTSGTTTPSGADADLYTINLNNNGGSNYSYTVSNLGTTAIPDPAFEQALIDLDLDCEIDGKVLTSNLIGRTSLDVSGKNISNLTGIEAFSSLQDFYCSDNSITGALDLSMLSNLRYIDCQNNLITSMNVTGLSNIETLVTWNNLLSNLNLSTNPNIIYLDCDDNNLTTLDVSGLTNLIDFYCSGNQLTDLDVRGLSSLGFFECVNNPSLSCILVDDVTAADGLESATDWAKDATATYSYCNCDLTTTWTSASGGSWNNGVPTSSTAAIIAYDYSEAAPIDACSLTINTNANVTIPSGYNVTLNAPLKVESGSSFALSNNANLIQTNKNSINTGSITVNRNSSLLKRLDYTLWSSPVSGAQTLADFSPLTSQSPSRFYSFDTTYNIGGVNGEYSAIATPTSTTFAAGAGYLIRMPNTADPVTPTAYSGVFTGLPNNGTVPVALIDGLAAGLRYNLVGNPYPSTVNMTQFVTDNSSNIESTLYFWRKTNGVGTAYCTWAPAVSPATGTFVSNGNTQSVDPLGVLQTGQGFFVEAKSGATSLTFNNSQRVADNAGQFFKTKQVVDAGRVWLNATNTAGDFSQMAVTYSAKATQGVDIYDGKYINDSKFALTSNINNGEYTIQSRPVFDTTDVVALNFKTATAGDYTIAIDHVDGLFATDQDIYLVDSKTGTETNLKTSSYNFTATSGVDNTRFSLKYQKTLKVDASTFNDNSVKVYVNNGTLYVNSGVLAIANIKIFDIQGRLIKEQTNIKSTTATIGNLRASNQVLIVQVKGEDNSEVTKKVMN